MTRTKRTSRKRIDMVVVLRHKVWQIRMSDRLGVWARMAVPLSIDEKSIDERYPHVRYDGYDGRL